MDVVHEPPPPVDLDDGNPLAVLGLELRHAVDRHLAKLESEFVTRGVDDTPRRVTEVAPRRRVEDDLAYG